MAVHELTDEQIRTWTLEQKDRWWLEKVYRGAMPQLTIRSALTGMLLGGVLSLTNLYIGAKTGWTLGVGITSVILAFALFKILASLGASEFTILENNAMQSIATAAGYMTSPMISSLAAYMMVTGHVIPMWQTMMWISVLAILGVLFAFPFKRRFINDEQQPFPEGRAAGIVMDSLHHGDAESGLLKAKLLLGMGLFAAGVKFLQDHAIVAWINAKAGFDWLFTIPEMLDEGFYNLIGGPPTLWGTPITNLTLRPELDIPMIGAGGLMGIRTGFSILLGSLINFALLAPIMIDRGDITRGPRGIIGFREITFWSLWCGVAMMTVASIIAFFAKPEILLSAFRGLWGGTPGTPPPPPTTAEPHGTFMQESITTEPVEGVATHLTDNAPPPVHPDRPPTTHGGDVLAHIELPLNVSLVGIPLLGVLVVWMAHTFFGVEWYLSIIAIAMVFFFCLIAINSTGLTSITPIGAMGKLTQLAFGVLAPGDKTVNLMTAGITGEVASHSANLLSDIKPGYMLGAKPRQQAVGHVLGVLAGALMSVPVFYFVFLGLSPEQLTATSLDATYQIDSEKYPMPAATIWKAVADALAGGIATIAESARWAALAGILVGIVFEVIRLRSHNRFPLSPVAIGLGFIIPFSTCLAMFAGSAIFWIAENLWSNKETKMNQVVVQNQEPICAGLIAGGAIMGILMQVLNVLEITKH